MKPYLAVCFLFLSLFSCNQSAPQMGLEYHIKELRYQREIDLPEFDEHTRVTLYDHWIVITYKDGKKVVVNRDKVWSIDVE